MMRKLIIVTFSAICFFLMANAMASSEEDDSASARRHPKDVSLTSAEIQEIRQRREAEMSDLKSSDTEIEDEKKEAAQKLGHFHGHGHGYKRYKRESEKSTTKSTESKSKENDKSEGTTRRSLRQIALHLTTEANKNRQTTPMKRQAIKESSTTPSGKENSRNEEESKARKSRGADKEDGDDSDSSDGPKEDEASRGRPLGGSYRLRRQEDDGQRRTPGVDHQRPTEETARKERQTAGAPGEPAGAPAPAPAQEDISGRRGGPRPVRPRPPSPPPPPTQGGGTLTLPDGVDLIVSPINSGFTCDQKIYGYYADTFNDCKLFHVCVPITNEKGDSTSIQWSFACGNQTLFNQELMTCDHKDNVDCTKAQDYYNLNENFGKTERPLA